ncbi:MAG: PAS domain S-box protein [Chloroflexi bacterium]|nr:PAS domain S-box protein [Chloroflexota bacterium]
MDVKKGTSGSKPTTDESVRQLDENSVLAEIGRIVNSSLDLEEVFEQAGNQIRILLSSDRIAINLFNQETLELKIEYVSGLDIPSCRVGKIIPTEGSMVLSALHLGNVLVGQGMGENEPLDEFSRMSEGMQVGIKSFMAIPLISKGTLVGTIGLQSLRPNAYSVNDVQTGERMAAYIAGAIVNAQAYADQKRAEEAQRRLAEENAVMAEIGRIVNSSLELDEVFERVASEIQRLISLDRVAINLFDQETRELKAEYVSGLDIPSHRVGNIVPTAGSAVLSSLQPGGATIAQGMDENELSQKYPGMVAGFQAGLRSFMVLPLVCNDTVAGTIELQSLKPDAYHEKDGWIAERAASHISGAIANAQLYSERKRAEEAQKRLAEENSVIAEIGRIISSSVDISEVYAQFGSMVSNLLPFNRISVSIADLTKGEAQTAYAWGDVVAGREPGDIFPLGGSATEMVAQTQSPIVCGASGVKELAIHGNLSDRLLETGMRSFIAVPLRAKNETTGSLQVHSRESDIYDDQHVRLLSTIADQIAGAITNSQLYSERAKAEEAQRRVAEENAVMAEIGRIVNSSLEIDDVFEQVVTQIGRLIPSDRLRINLVDNEMGVIKNVYVSGLDLPDYGVGSVIPLQGSSALTALQSGRAQVVQGMDESELSQAYPSMLAGFKAGLMSFMALPLISDDVVVGTIGLLSREPNAYDDNDVLIGERIASQISGAIANSQLYSRLRNSENKLRAVFESTSSGILTMDGSGVIESLNPALEKLFGYTADEMTGKNISILIPETYQERQQDNLPDIISAGHFGIDRELVGLKKNGSFFPLELVVSEIELDGHRSFNGIIRDITARKKSEQDLQRLATIVESVNDPIIAIDTEYRITVWNAAAEKLYGYSADEALGRPFDLIIPPHKLQKLEDTNTTVFDGKDLAAYDTQRVAKSGEIIDITTSGSPIFDRHGAVVGAVGVHRDITDRKHAEREMRESEERFNARILEEKAYAEEIQVRKTQQLQTISEIAAALSGPTDFRTKAESVSSIIREKLEADAVALRMLDEDRQTLDLVASDGLRFLGLPDSMSLADEGFSQRAFKEGKSVMIGDYSKVPEAIPGAIARGLKSICSIGLRGADGPNGLLNIASRNPDHFNPERMELLETIAGAIAALFESARLSEILERTRKEIEVTDEVARIIISTLDIETKYDEFFAEMKKLIDFDHAGLVLMSENGQQATIGYATESNPLSYIAGQAFDLAGSLFSRVVEIREGITITDMTNSDYRASEQLVRRGMLSLMVTPLIFEEKVIGEFVLHSSKKNYFGNRERLILERLASQVAPSVRNAILYREADQFALALDSIGEAVAFLDVDAGIRHVNRTFEETFGYTADELRGQPIAMIAKIPGFIDEQGREIFEQGILDGWSGEVHRRTKSGNLLDILLTVTPVKDKSGQVIGRISVSRDITERKKTAEYLNEQSRLAAVGKLAAGVAHEINNPLTSILLGAQLLAESDLSEEHLKDLAIISDAALRAEKIVKNLLLFARREDPLRTPMALDSIAKQSLELKKYDFRVNNIKTTLDFEDDLPDSLVDRHQMSQVIVNILNNAEQALVSHKNGGEITIKTYSTPEAVVLEIRDDGPGVDPELIGRVFEPFFTTKGAGEGTGLGLSICYGIVQQHGGEMWATTQIDVGSSFYVQLPISDGLGVSDIPIRERQKTDGGSKGRLLVVDDDVEIRQLVAKSLSNDLVTVDQADNGETALNMIRGSDYDCILLDLKMPGISGIEVFEQSIKYDHRIAGRIIVITGDTASPETASFLSKMNVAVMHKPFTLDEVRKCVRGILEMSR